MASKKLPKFSDQIRQAVRASGVMPAHICEKTGIDKSTLSRFLSGERGLPMKTLDRLAAFLALRIVCEK